MAKQKKKRNKVYSGNMAASRPAVTRVQAVNRSKFGQWWFDNKRIAKPVAAVIGIVIGLAVVIIGLVGIFTR